VEGGMRRTYKWVTFGKRSPKFVGAIHMYANDGSESVLLALNLLRQSLKGIKAKEGGEVR
jgi:hypothetical protein